MKGWTDTEQSSCVLSNSSSQCCDLWASQGAESSWSAEQPSSGVVCAQLQAKGAEEFISWRQISSTLLVHKRLFSGECPQGLVSFGLFGCEWHSQVQDELQKFFADSPTPFSILVPPFCSATFPCGKRGCEHKAVMKELKHLPEAFCKPNSSR